MPPHILTRLVLAADPWLRSPTAALSWNLIGERPNGSEWDPSVSGTVRAATCNFQ